MIRTCDTRPRKPSALIRDLKKCVFLCGLCTSSWTQGRPPYPDSRFCHRLLVLSFFGRFSTHSFHRPRRCCTPSRSSPLTLILTPPSG
jgi:hypothetical protein